MLLTPICTSSCRAAITTCLAIFLHGSALILTPMANAEVVTSISEKTLKIVRSGSAREWAEFPADAQPTMFEHRFNSTSNTVPWTLSIRQQDVKETWTVSLNEKTLGRLVRDENDLRCDFEIPEALLRTADNHLVIRANNAKQSDDIRVGEIQIHNQSPVSLRDSSTIEVVITDDEQRLLPGRLTIVDENGTLMPITPKRSTVKQPAVQAGEISDGETTDSALAAREGVLYTATGHAVFAVSPGRYRIYAGRGFEYETRSTDLTIKKGQHAKRTLRLTREVNTEGWIACDTHVHTVTYSGHGDCTLQERLVTLAGEGIEMPIATDHNTQIDYTKSLVELGAAKWFTPVVGNEVTTKRGHFNIFPTSADSPRPDHQAENWSELFDSIFGNTQVKVAILNHARDLHSNFRPFSPRHHLSMTGTNRDGFDRRFNAMEMINSGAVQTDPMELFRDWCGLINHGMQVTPVGSSDSHDVSRFIVGQGRTYIAGDDSKPGQVDIDAAVESFLQGKVIVSYGLFANLIAYQEGSTQKVGPGEILKVDQEINQNIILEASVSTPGWSNASTLELWINGEPWAAEHFEEKPDSPTPSEIQRKWVIPNDRFSNDFWFTLIARGPGIDQPFWPTAKPYQPDSIEFEPYVFSCTGPIRVDRNGDGQYDSARAQANALLEQAGSLGINTPIDLEKLGRLVQDAEKTVAFQILAMIRPQITDFSAWAETLTEETRLKIEPFERAFRECVRAELEQVE